MKARIPTIFISAVALVSNLCGCYATGYTVFPETPVFSSDILFTAKIIGGRPDRAHSRMVDLLNEIDGQVSTTRADSGLNKFNAAGAGERVEVGEHCYKLFSLACEYYELTGGAFDPASLTLAELWRIDAASIAEPGAKIADLPSPEAVAACVELCDPSLVTATAENGKYYFTKTVDGVKLDFGGIAKGYAADRCAAILDEYDISSAFLDISGNAYFYGDYIDGSNSTAWHVGITSPRPRAGDTVYSRGVVAAVNIGADMSAVTSGDYMRYNVYDGANGSVYIPHIMDCDGAPIGVEYDSDIGEWKNSEEYVISATVVGASSALCDALSTAVAVLGMERGAALLQKVGYKGLIFTEKRYTIVGDVELYRRDKYNGYEAYEFYDCDGDR